jgi:hypothetical protein
MIYAIALEQVPAAWQQGFHQAGPCTLKMGVHLAALGFPRPGFTGLRNRGSAVVILELRDSQTNEPLVRYGQRRELATGGRTTDGTPDLDRLEGTLREVLHEVRLALQKSLVVNPTGARAGLGCKGVVGEVRKAASEQ